MGEDMSSTWYYISTLKDYVLLWHYTTLAKNEWLLRSWHPTLWLIIGQNQDLLMQVRSEDGTNSLYIDPRKKVF